VSDTYIAHRFYRKRNPPDVYGARRDYKIFLSARFRRGKLDKLIFSLVQVECRVNNESADVVNAGFDDAALMEKP
jgi:hypothetical protein